MLERLCIDADPASPALAVRLSEGVTTRVTMVRPGDSATRQDRYAITAEYETDGRLLHYAISDGALLEMSLADALRAYARGGHLLSVESDEPVRDLHASVRGDCLDLVSTCPPARLRLGGEVLRSPRVIRVNGREVRPPRRQDASAVAIVRADWGAPERDDTAIQRPMEIGARPAFEFAAGTADR
jgi:hypothetical protein